MTASPCDLPLAYRSLPPIGPATTVPLARTPHPKADCFFAYPTDPTSTTPNTPLEASAAVKLFAQAQAAPFASRCRLFVPLYRAASQAALTQAMAGDAAGKQAMDVAYASLRASWHDFLANRSKGRSFVLIGDSQGAVLLTRLIRAEVDGSADLRSRLVSAILVGANVTVATGPAGHGAFANIPTCKAATQRHCFVAYSAFYERPPANATFGVPGQGIGLLWGQRGAKDVKVACVNPASFVHGVAHLDPLWLDNPAAPAPYLTYPGLYRSICQQSADASWLSVTVLPSSTFPASAHPNVRPVAAESSPELGLHRDEFSMALYQLVNLVGQESFAAATR